MNYEIPTLYLHYTALPTLHGLFLGRRFAEQDLYVGLCRLLLKFRLQATSDYLPEQEWSMLLKPKTPLPVQFVKRE